MKVAIIYNKDMTGVINTLGIQNKEIYNPKTVKKVAAALEKSGHNVEIIDGNMNVIKRIQNFLPKTMEGEKMGMVFNMAYGIQGESRYTHIPSMLEMLGIPYVGSNPSGHALALDKVITKIIMQRNDIPTPNFWVFSSHEEDMTDVEYPVIVKPKMESVSFGLRVVDNIAELKDAVKFIIEEFTQQALVEQFISGREFCVGLLGNEPVEAFPILEIDLDNDPNAIQSMDDKKKKPRGKLCPAPVSDELAKAMKDLSIRAFKSLQLRDFARVDIRMDQNNNIYLLEINSMASMGQTGSYPYAASVAGYDYDALVNKILDVAATRYFFNIQKTDLNASDKKIPLQVRMRSYLRSRQEVAEKLLQKITDINTHVRNVEGVNHLSTIIKKELTLLGFSFEVIPQVEVGHPVFFTNSDDGKYDFLLLGNLDNDLRINEQEYFSHNESKIFGTGVWENKGGIVVMLMALQALRYARRLRKTRIGILLTSDDTLQGRFARSIVERKSEGAKYVIGLHGAFLNGEVVTSRSGAANYRCTMNLKKRDDAKYVSMAVSAFSKLLNTWVNLSDADNGLIISPSDVIISSNITEPYAHADASLSVRFSDAEQMKSVDQKIRKALPAKYKDIIHLQVEGGLRRPAMLYSDKTDEIWKETKNIADRLDIRLNREHRWSSADICFVGDDKAVIDGMGPIGSKPNNKSEYILRHSLLERATLLALTINRLRSLSAPKP